LHKQPFPRWRAISSCLATRGEEPPMFINSALILQSAFRRFLTPAILLATAAIAGAQTYTVTDLGTLGRNSNGNNYSIAYCINGAGLIGGGSSSPIQNMSDPAFLYSNGQLTNIGTLGGEYGEARAINTSGQIAGYSTQADGSYRGFVYSNGH